MSDYLTPILLLTGVSFANKWYNTQQVDLKILLEGGIATAILGIVNNIEGMPPVTRSIAWIAFIAMLIAPIQNPSPLDNLLKITGS